MHSGHRWTWLPQPLQDRSGRIVESHERLTGRQRTRGREGVEEMKCDCQEALLHHATRLREARARLLEDAESTDVFVAIEQAGKFVCANTEARLRKSANRINELLEAGGCHGTAHAVLTDRVRKARNARMHEGIVGRASGRRAWELALRLETAFRKKATEVTGLKAKDVMERDVITAKSWQTLYEVRREMLINAVSVLPWKDGDTLADGEPRRDEPQSLPQQARETNRCRGCRSRRLCKAHASNRTRHGERPVDVQPQGATDDAARSRPLARGGDAPPTWTPSTACACIAEAGCRAAWRFDGEGPIDGRRRRKDVVAPVPIPTRISPRTSDR